MTQENKCLVCSSIDTVLNITCKDYLTGGESFDIYSCKNCGFNFTHKPPPERGIEKYYNTADYISHSDTSEGITNTLYHITRRMMLRRKRNIIMRATGLKTGTLLDIGCGTGYFAAFMRDSGWKVTGLEINENARHFAKEKFSLDVISIPELASFDENHFDSITLWHVFEHFHDPQNYINEIRRLLSPGGKCIIAMPNCSSFDARHYGRFWAAWDVPRHLWHFAPDTFRAFTAKNGLEITAIKTLPADVFYISILSEKHRGANLPFLTGMIKGLWFAILSAFSKMRSSSLIYVLDLIPQPPSPKREGG
jgi:2-polyprenyl-3-methyl-5-hydroxy-6-metoxy-1,4-benzoquinol methylase